MPRVLTARRAALLALVFVLPACSYNKTTGRNQFTAGLSPQAERQMGLEAAPQLTEEFGGQVQNSELTGYITEVGMRLKDQTETDGPQRTWVFTLLDSDVINAFALPGERVFMSKGLSDKLVNEAELAGVLGHEIGHVMARHTAERIGQSTLIGIGAQALGAVAGAAVKDPTLGQALPAIATQGGQLIVLKYSRSQESEADALGMRYMTKAGYNPRGQLEVMQILKREAGSGTPPEFLSTHPLPDTRIKDVQNALNKEYAQQAADTQHYQFFAERYQQRYLSIASKIPPKKQAPPKKTAKSAMLDDHGRERLLGSIDLDDPASWCAICRAHEDLAAADRWDPLMSGVVYQP